VAQGEGPEFKPQYDQKKKKKGKGLKMKDKTGIAKTPSFGMDLAILELLFLMD
jgi:hypothetical protein